MKTILDLSIMAELQKAAPKVTTPSWETHQAVVKALSMYASSHKAQIDSTNIPYWRTNYDALIELTQIPDLTPNKLGYILRSFCLTLKRENDGYRVAWSEKQVSILKQAFGL